MKTEAEDLLVLYSQYLTELGRSTITIKDYLSNLKLFLKWYQLTYDAQSVDFTQIAEIDLLSYRSYLQHEKRRKTSTQRNPSKQNRPKGTKRLYESSPESR